MIKTEAYNESTQFLGLTTKNGFKAGKLYTQKPLSAADAFVVDRNLAAYRINQSGVLELMAANVPRVDYKNGCPEILIENEATNSLIRSEEFNTTAWSNRFGLSISANAINAPNDTLTADRVIENSANSDHYFYQTASVTAGTTYTMSLFVKNNGRRYCYLLDGYTANGRFFDLQEGLVLGNFIGSSVGNIESLSNGWYRISVTVTSSGSLMNLYFGLSNNGTSLVYTGDGTSGFYIWGAQLEQSSFTNTITNTISQPNSLTLSFGGVIGTDDTTAPNGTMTADSFNVNDNAYGGTYKVITLINGNTYTYSVWLKGSVNGQKVLVQTDYNGDLATFTLTTDWVRYSVTFVANSGLTQNLYLLNGLYVSPTNNEIYYTWGQQLDLKIFPTSYIPTTATIVTRPPDIIENNTINYDINQATIFVRARLDFSTDVRGIITLYDGGPFENYITIYSEIIGAVKKIVFQTYTDPDENKYELTVPSDGIYNMAFAYDLTANTYAIAVNGNIEFSGTFGNITPTSSELNTLTLGRIGSFYDARVIGSMFFDSKLDNTSLENLTA
jgi:hypothetical protein